jgi:hypothetical protein
MIDRNRDSDPPAVRGNPFGNLARVGSAMGLSIAHLSEHLSRQAETAFDRRKRAADKQTGEEGQKQQVELAQHWSGAGHVVR